MKKLISNAFSLQMLKSSAYLIADQVAPEEIPQDVVSVVGHPDTANILSGILGFPVPFNREAISLEEGDILYVAQYSGSRLPEGATTLPEGASFTFWKIKIGETCPSDLMTGGVCVY